MRPAVPLLLALAAMPFSGAAMADRIKNPTAVFAGLDKITGRIINFEATTDETVQFGSLQVTPKVCYTRPPTEAPQTTTFVEVDEVAANNEYKRIFGGWMYASSPGLHGVEHPIYDIWLTACKGGTDIIKTPLEVSDLPPPDPLPKPGTVPRPRRPQPGEPGYVAPVASQPAPQSLQPVAAAPRRTPSQSFFPTSAGAPRDISNSGSNR